MLEIIGGAIVVMLVVVAAMLRMFIIQLGEARQERLQAIRTSLNEESSDDNLNGWEIVREIKPGYVYDPKKYKSCKVDGVLLRLVRGNESVVIDWTHGAMLSVSCDNFPALMEEYYKRARAAAKSMP